MDYAAVSISVLALLFTLASFWWLYARRGKLAVARPATFAFAHVEGTLRLRFPFTFFNSGAKALIVTDLRLVIADDPGLTPLRWVTTRSALRPASDDGFAFATPFAIHGRDTESVIAEFEEGDEGWSPHAAFAQLLRLEARVHPSSQWVEVGRFDWWPPPAEKWGQYIAHRNEPV